MKAIFIAVFFTMVSASLMVFHVGPIWVKPVLIFVGIIVAIMYAIANNYRSDDRIGEDPEKSKEKSKKSKDESEEPPKEEKPKEEPPKEEKKKEDPKKATDAKKHPWQQESKGGGFGAFVIAIIILAGVFYLVSSHHGPAFLQKPETEPPVQTEYSSGGETVSPKEEASKPAETKEYTINAKYTPGEQEIKIGTLAPGEYKVSVIDSDFTYQRITPDGNVIDAWLVGPEGMVGRKFNNQSEFLLPDVDPLARLIKVGDDPWQFLGAGTTIHIEKESDVFVTINVRRNPLDFCNTGGDVIEVKRSGQ
jgi:cytoskeletal protein RodZ